MKAELHKIHRTVTIIFRNITQPRYSNVLFVYYWIYFNNNF